MPPIFWEYRNDQDRKAALAVALTMMLSPFVRDIGTAPGGAGVELVGGRRPAYPPWAVGEAGADLPSGPGLASGAATAK
ncbi:hypothetical protein [Bradyrhizobium sp.]|uniref:hypothetical protein n=1 Tax=Bradyrhizobium sp. TaxID=376 RepID=UPI001ED02284|nr:hypothetical protein [Bradyrhizobium sp.]MBV8919029.1 hypothetical protein [Bradyrhizobium sp.]MBV9982882.1 hypothetical protein [Bradyrhizobium sp.]